MDDLERQLRQRLHDHDWKLTPPRGAKPRVLAALRRRRLRRRLATAGGVLATGAIVVAAVSVLGSEGPQGTSPPAANETKPVPWSDTPGRSMHVNQTTEAPNCQPAQVKASPSGQGAYHGSTVQNIDIQNIDVANCNLALPVLRVASPDGEEVAVDPGKFGDTTLTLTPGERATLMVGASAGCPDSEIGRLIRIMTTPDATPIQMDTWIALDCGPVSVMTFEDSGLPEQTPPQAELTAEIIAPDSATPGEDLSYVVMLGNPTDRAISLSPCPSYTESLKESQHHQTLQLNCQEADPVIPAGQSVDFEMVIAVPGNAPEHSSLGWHLEVPGGAIEDAPITIQ